MAYDVLVEVVNKLWEKNKDTDNVYLVAEKLQKQKPVVPQINKRSWEMAFLLKLSNSEKDYQNFENVKLNVTAVFTTEQVVDIIERVVSETPMIISIFAGRIADTGVNPEEIISESILYRKLVKPRTPIEFLWASSREAYNYVQAEKSGCEIITMSPDLIKKVDKFGKDLDLFSIETVQMFYDDAVKSGYRID